MSRSQKYAIKFAIEEAKEYKNILIRTLRFYRLSNVLTFHLILIFFILLFNSYVLKSVFNRKNIEFIHEYKRKLVFILTSVNQHLFYYS